MSSLFTESPIFLACLCAVCSGLLALWWIQARSKLAAYACAGSLLVGLVLVWLNVQIVTPREQIYAILNELVEAVRRNDHQQLSEHVHPNASAAIRVAEYTLPRYTFRHARLTRVKDIAINQAAQPPSAVAEFNVTATISISSQDVRVARFIRLFFMQRGDQWLVNDIEHFEPTAGFRDEP